MVNRSLQSPQTSITRASLQPQGRIDANFRRVEDTQEILEPRAFSLLDKNLVRAIAKSHRNRCTVHQLGAHRH
jgi:hypothetical protein